MLQETVNDVWGTDIQKRVNHVVIDALVKSLEEPKLGVESKGVIFNALNDLVEDAEEVAKARGLELTDAQQLLLWWLETYLDEGEWKGKLDTAPLPPGSPI